MREELRPKIAAALDEVGLTPQNLPGQVARKKLIEELLDQICERGFLSMGDLRDAISRNNLKLPDISGFLDFAHGDQLLRADRKLALALDGVYRRGEVYLRWMQRLSSLGFGTRIGRFSTRFAVVPYGGAFVTVAFVHEAWEIITRAKRAEKFHLPWPGVMLPLGLFLMFLVNSATFRRALGGFFKASFQVLHAVIVEPIRWMVQSPWLQRIVHSRSFTLLFRFIIKPLLWTGIFWCVSPREHWRTNPVGASAIVFLGVNLLLNSRIGRTAEEVVVDELVQGCAASACV